MSDREKNIWIVLIAGMVFAIVMAGAMGWFDREELPTAPTNVRIEHRGN